MKFLTGMYEGQEVIGVLVDDETQCMLLKDMGLHYQDMNDFIANKTKEDYRQIQDAIIKCEGTKTEAAISEETKVAGDESVVSTIDMSDITLMAPIPVPKQDLICLGVNYLDHAKESAAFRKEALVAKTYPVYFSKRVNKASGANDVIPYNEEAFTQLDYEVELAVVIGKDAKNVKKEEVLDYIFGYTVVNDVSARDVQLRHGQWYFGKSMDGFTPMGPVIVTADTFDGIPNLKLTSKVNGEVRQSSETILQQFDIPYVIHELSKGMTLKAGTIIATGTPAGVGMGFKPPRFLEVGDVVECEIEGIGKLVNTVSAL